MAYGSIDGVFSLGGSLQMVTVDNPRQAQVNTYPGLNGIEELDQGLRGRYTMVRGRLAANNPYVLGVLMQQFRSFNDGRLHSLLDTDGVVWNYVKLEVFQPEGKAIYAPPIGYSRAYTARFRHIL
jgi:hypothetical protein